MQESLIPNILTAITAHFLAVISPGPDFILITRNSLKYSRKTAIYSALGLGLGILVHVTYSLVGIALIISQSLLLFSLIKILGAIYLINIGIKSLKPHSHKSSKKDEVQEKDISKLEAIKMGFLTNATNPKATLFFLSLFTLVIKPSTPMIIKLILGLEMSIVTFLWFALIAILFTHKAVAGRIGKIQVIAEKVMGVILIVIGIELIISVLKTV